MNIEKINHNLDLIRSGIESLQSEWRRCRHGGTPDLSRLRRACQASQALSRQAEALTRAFGEKAFVYQARRLDRNLSAILDRFASGRYREEPPMFVHADINGLRHQFEQVNKLIQVETVVLQGNTAEASRHQSLSM